MFSGRTGPQVGQKGVGQGPPSVAGGGARVGCRGDDGFGGGIGLSVRSCRSVLTG